jgi:hypothetical protein
MESVYTNNKTSGVITVICNTQQVCSRTVVDTNSKGISSNVSRAVGLLIRACDPDVRKRSLKDLCDIIQDRKFRHLPYGTKQLFLRSLKEYFTARIQGADMNKPSLEEIKRYFNTVPVQELPYLCFLYVQSNHDTDSSVSDPNLVIMRPAKFIDNTRVDCDDVSLFFYSLYKRTGLEVKMVIFYKEDQYQQNSFGHVACLFKSKGDTNWSYLDNANIETLRSSEIKNAINNGFVYFATKAAFLDGDKLLIKDDYEVKYATPPADKDCFWVKNRDCPSCR